MLPIIFLCVLFVLFLLWLFTIKSETDEFKRLHRYFFRALLGVGAVFLLCYSLSLDRPEEDAPSSGLFSLVFIGGLYLYWPLFNLLFAGLIDPDRSNSTSSYRKIPPCHHVFWTGFAAHFALVVLLMTIIFSISPSFAPSPDTPSPADSPASAVVTAQEGQYIASTGSTKFHKKSCRHAHNINPDNAVYYTDRWDAVDDGRTPCTVCDP